MKEKDIKDAYENVEISEAEKNKIYNNIMENRKKRFNWGPIIGFGALAAASFGLFNVREAASVPPIITLPAEAWSEPVLTVSLTVPRTVNVPPVSK